MKLLFIGAILFGCSYGISQSSDKQKTEDLFFEITIQSGTGVYGVTSIKLMYEGLLLRTFKEDHDGSYKTLKKLIDLKTLDSAQILVIFKLIEDKGFMSFENRTVSNPHYSPPIVIRILDLNRNEFNVINYDTFNVDLDELLVEMNKLVPRELNHIYQTKRIKP